MFPPIVETLYSNIFFEGISKDDLLSLDFRLFKEMTIDKDKLLIEQNTTGDTMFLISSGDVVISKVNSNVEFEIARRGAGEYVGEMALFDGEPRSANVKALTKLNLFVIDSNTFFYLLNRFGVIKNNLIRHINSVIRDNGVKFSEKGISQSKLLSKKDIELFRTQSLLNQTIELKRNIDEQKEELKLINRELERKNRELYQLTIIDPLTNVYSKNHFNKLLENEFSRSIRHDIELCLLVIDIDDFKIFNDSYGHLIGDRVLKHTAETMTMAIRKEDILGRIGGEEFAIILPHLVLDEAVVLANKIVKQVESKTVTIHGIELGVTISIGVTDSIVGSPETGMTLLHQGDIALYKAKRMGRNRVESFTTDLEIISAN